MTYNLPDGTSVRTFRVGANVEFHTFAADGRTISSVQKSHAEAQPLLMALHIKAVAR